MNPESNIGTGEKKMSCIGLFIKHLLYQPAQETHGRRVWQLKLKHPDNLVMLMMV